MVYVVLLPVVLISALFGAFMLFTPMKKLIESVAWMGLPMPKEESGAYTALRLFWRGIGVIAWLFVAAALYVVFFHRS